MLESMDHYVKEGNEDKQENLGYLLGWFCGGILILGVIVSAINLFQHHYRKAFQAIILPFGPIAWMFLCMSGFEPLLRDPSEFVEAVMMISLFGGIIALPFLELRFLKNMAWPLPESNQEASHPRVA